jgi:hypothetical protein
MVRLRSLDVISCAKIYGIMHFIIGILLALFFVLIGLVGLAAAPGRQKFGMIGVLVFAALAPFLYAVFGFVAGAISALLYNWIASIAGGIKMELETVPVPQFVPPSAPLAADLAM